tara:strand:+ start:2543 stop:2878 length:336 start_codon:yes stop_codon:yes gene_type:complete
MSEGNKKVKVALLAVINKAAEPASYRLNSLLRDFYREEIHLSEEDHLVLLELTTAAKTLKHLLTEYIAYAETLKAENISLPAGEFAVLVELAKIVQSSYGRSVSGIPLWTH